VANRFVMILRDATGECNKLFWWNWGCVSDDLPYEEASVSRPRCPPLSTQRSLQPRARLDFTTLPKGPCDSRDVFENTVASCFFPERSKELDSGSRSIGPGGRIPFHSSEWCGRDGR